MLDGRAKDEVSVGLIILDPQSGAEILNIGMYVSRAEWVSFINSGYTVSFILEDVHHVSLSKLFEIGLLKYARKNRFMIKFAFGWSGKTRGTNDQKLCWTDDRYAIVTHVDCPRIDRLKTRIVIEAVDPASWYINRGTSSGKAYRGCIGGNDGVIAQVAREYTEGIDVKVSDTIDNPNNVWHMMRMDPKSFILTLMEWSASLTVDGTPWIVRSQDTNLIIEEMARMTPPLDHNGKPFIDRPVVINTDDAVMSEMVPNGMSWYNNPLLSIMQTRLYTAGISAVTGKYVDYITEKPSVETYDLNTSKKLNVKILDDRGFTKPEDTMEWSTFIKPVPEHNNGDIGVFYWNYMSGRARDYFMKLLYTTMRIDVRIIGDPNFDNVDILGPSTVNLRMNDLYGKPHALSGPWMIYGFRHIIKRGGRHWETNLYLSRLDWNAVAKTPQR